MGRNIIIKYDWLMPFIGKVGRKDREKVCYTTCKVSSELASGSTAHSILGESGAKNRRWKKQLTSPSRPPLTAGDRLDAARDSSSWLHEAVLPGGRSKA